jgi:hypothetical protein
VVVAANSFALHALAAHQRSPKQNQPTRHAEAGQAVTCPL